MKRFCCFFLVMFLALPFASTALAAYNFTDDRFAGIFTTENLNAIIEEYELYDGWYWSTLANTAQTYHGIPECPGWTDTAVNRHNRSGLPEACVSVILSVWNTVPIK